MMSSRTTQFPRRTGKAKGCCNWHHKEPKQTDNHVPQEDSQTHNTHTCQHRHTLSPFVLYVTVMSPPAFRFTCFTTLACFRSPSPSSPVMLEMRDVYPSLKYVSSVSFPLLWLLAPNAVTWPFSAPTIPRLRAKAATPLPCFRAYMTGRSCIAPKP